jgi:esterase FrsA
MASSYDEIHHLMSVPEEPVPYTYPIETEAMFEDRTGQFIAFGVPAVDVERMHATITDMWLDGPGGWVYEWSALGAEYAAKGDHYLASLVYGCAKFPCLAHEPRTVALAKQVEEYLAAAPSFPVRFERRVLTVPYAGQQLTSRCTSIQKRVTTNPSPCC